MQSVLTVQKNKVYNMYLNAAPLSDKHFEVGVRKLWFLKVPDLMITAMMFFLGPFIYISNILVWPNV